MDKISDEDIHMLYCGSVCLYKGIPVKVTDSMRQKVVVKYLETGKLEEVKFALKDFSAPIGRIGFVNVMHVALYITRMPLRQYTVGVKAGNIRVSLPEYKCNMDMNVNAIQRHLSNMECPEIAQAMLGRYPGINDAIALALEHKGSYAFDRQFAVDHERKIYYKLKHVGHLPRGAVTLEDTVFRKDCEYLQLPLLQHYEKTLRTFGNA